MGISTFTGTGSVPVPVPVNLGRCHKNYPKNGNFFMSSGEICGPSPKERRGKEKRGEGGKKRRGEGGESVMQ